MAKRAQGLRLDASLPQSALQEPVQLRARGRLGLPLEIASGVTWLTKRANHDLFALAVLEEPGKIALLSWEQESDKVLDERRRLIDAAEHAAIRLLDDRYRKIQVAKDARVTLTLSHVLHLGLPVDADAYVYVALVGGVIEIFSPAYRDRELSRAAAMFPDLP